MNNKKLSKVIETIILCAGRGKRMRYKTNYSAKPLIKIRNKPILEINLNYLYKAGIKNCVVNNSYKYINTEFIKNSLINIALSYIPHMKQKTRNRRRYKNASFI